MIKTDSILYRGLEQDSGLKPASAFTTTLRLQG